MNVLCPLQLLLLQRMAGFKEQFLCFKYWSTAEAVAMLKLLFREQRMSRTQVTGIQSSTVE
jgi:hypothetical protein